MSLNVMSLFDGISCGRLALERAGIAVDNYYASEIDPFAIKVAKKNWPGIEHIGDVSEVLADDFPRIDLLIGGSPCQGFSSAGKGLNFNDPRSKLFFEYVRLLKELKPKYFLLENVCMKKQYQDIISGLLGVQPIKINSALVSAQNRKRLYWTNIPNITQPEDESILLADILEKGFADRDKSYCIDANYWKGGDLSVYLEKSRRQLVFSEPIVFEKPHGYVKGGMKNKKKFAALRSCTNTNYAIYDNNAFRKLTPTECERLQTLPDDYSSGVSATQRYKLLGNGWTVDVVAHIFKGLK